MIFVVINLGLAEETAFRAGNETVLHSFRRAQEFPANGLALDAQGNLYGSAGAGGVGCGTTNDGCGVIFKLISQGGQWHYQVLYAFQGGSDGNSPNPVMLDAGGNIYGTTNFGGDYNCGTAFKLAPNSDGTWTFSRIYEFKGSPDGCNPTGRLILNTAGKIYGVTGTGGFLYGVAFELTLTVNGWKETVLHSFQTGHDYVDGA